MDNIADSIKELRERRGWSQLVLAEKLDVEQSTVSRWERGVAKPVGHARRRLEKLFTSRKGAS